MRNESHDHWDEDRKLWMPTASDCLGSTGHDCLYVNTLTKSNTLLAPRGRGNNILQVQSLEVPNGINQMGKTKKRRKRLYKECYLTDEINEIINTEWLYEHLTYKAESFRYIRDMIQDHYKEQKDTWYVGAC